MIMAQRSFEIYEEALRCFYQKAKSETFQVEQRLM
jgi:hypothetical protein